MKLFSLAIVTSVIISSCSKTTSVNSTTSINSQKAINVSCQQYIDALGNPLEQVGNCLSPSDSAGFTQQELNLFNSLDTADLSGTTVPAASYSFAIYPNPILSDLNIQYHFNNSFSGQIVAKYVITDSLLNPVYKTIAYLNFTSPYSSLVISLQTSIPAGKYRLFQTLSAQSYNNFSRSWINITKSN